MSPQEKLKERKLWAGTIQQLNLKVKTHIQNEALYNENP